VHRDGRAAGCALYSLASRAVTYYTNLGEPTNVVFALNIK